MFVPPHLTKQVAFVQDLERRMAQWRRIAAIGHPATSADYIRTVCEEIVRRAEILSTLWAVDFKTVAVFLLERSEAWVMAGLPIEQIGRKLPKNLTDLGIMKLSEGSDQTPGAPLTGAELKQVSKHFRKTIN